MTKHSHKLTKFIVKIFLIVTMILSMCVSTGSTPVKALDTTPKDFVAGKQINYPWWWSKKIGSNKAWSTNFMHYNGKVAYCLEASKDTPPDQKYPAQVIDTNVGVRKLLYYGYGGPGYNADVKKIYQSTLTACVPDDFSEGKGNWDDGAYLFTHIWLSYAYSGDLMELNLSEFNKKWPNPDGNGGYGDNILAGYKWIMAQPDIGYAKWNPSSDAGQTASLKAEFDPVNKNQKTNTVKLEGTNAQANITLQNNVTLHNVTTGATQTGGTYTLNSGQSFYLTAPCKNSPSDYESGNVAGAGCQTYTALAIHSGNNYQTVGSWNWDPDKARLYYDVDWMDFGALRLSKVDNTSNFQKNSKFRLVSTSYNGYDETFEVTKDEDGDYELLVDYLPVGTYSLTEVDCEDYFAPTVAQWQVTIVKDKTTKKIVVNTLRPTGTLDVQKTLENANEGATNVADKDITKTKYQVIATDDIIDTVSLKKLYSKGDVVTLNSGKCVIDTSDGNTMSYSQGVQVSKGKMDAKGNISVDENGQLELTGLPLGKYQVIETECPKGYVLDQTPYDFTITQKDYTTTVYTVSHNQNNKITKTTFNKTDVTGEQEVTGAKMSVTDEDGQVIDSWTSGDKSHEIDGLEAGKTYYLNEDTSPAGYVKSSKIEFKVNEDGEVQKVDMKDKIVSFTKTDVTAEQEVTGAKITVKEKETGKVVDKWTSGKDEHRINGLEEGKTYILSETVSPEEYVKANDIEFTVSKEKVNQKVNMKDKQVVISKTTVGGEEVTGASMQILDEDGNVVDEWISDGRSHFATGLEEGKKYVLHEDLAPAGLNLANDIEFEVTYDKENQTVKMVDTKNEVTKTDEKGNLLKGAELTVTSKKTKNIIDKWVTGEHIFDVTDEMKTQLSKEGKVEGTYMDDEDSMVTFSIAKNKDKDDYTLMFVKDGETTYTNIDINGDETTHMIQGLVAGEEYVLKETKTPKGYATFKEQTFKANDENNNLMNMTDEDTKIEISKQDITDHHELEGAKLKVTDKDGKVIDEWTSGKQPHMIKNLTAGETYTLTEVIAPKNYKVAESVTFTVADTGVTQKVVMYDELMPVAKKVKTGDNNKIGFYMLIAGLSVALFGLIYTRKKIKE